MKTNNTALDKLIAAYKNPHLINTENRTAGLRIFGYMTENIPVELLYAAGILPVRIQSGNNADLAALHVQAFSCSYSRATIHQAMNGDYDYLDGIISSKTCDVMMCMFQIWGYAHPPNFRWLLSLPGNCNADAISYFKEELLHLKSALEKHCNTDISDEKIDKAISLYNRIRHTVNRLWTKKNDGTLNLTAGELVRALKGCQVLPPDSALQLIEELFDSGTDLKNAPDEGTRLMLIGNTYADVSLIDMIENVGGTIVIDDTSSVGHLFGPQLEPKGDPLTSLATYYSGKVTGPYRLTYEKRWGHILEMAEKWKIDGCINIIQKFCDSSLFESTLINQSMNNAEIPYIAIEIDDTSPGLGTIETRIEAFVEMVGGI